ncbi:MAG: hypothetical protein OXE92_00465 [Bacteroidetes bacterium]|nr:hypothetical protein [Bacteroidota bacterium]MCY4204182.1 hypothetical protein [Bacteroidota bacterium]
MRICWLLVLLLVACERPFVETTQPELQVIEPDLTEVQTSQVITILVKSTHFRILKEVSLNGVQMKPAPPGPGHWTTSLGLRHGINRFYLDATDEEGVSRRDTAYAVYLPHQISRNAPALPEGRGGHSTIRLRDGSVMVTGGARQQGNLAQSESFLLDPTSDRFIQMEARLLTPRTGHTASLLPDGKVLIVGGSRIDSPSEVSDLIETVEIIDPTASQPGFIELPVRGQAIRRTHHTAIIHEDNGELLLDLAGGYGDLNYGANPFFGVRQDLRTFRIESDEVIALNTRASAPFIYEPVAGHTVTQSQPDSYFILGSQFMNGDAINGNMRIHYPGGSRVDFSPLPGLRIPRTYHATASIFGGIFGLFGGRLESSDISLQIEIFHESTDQFFTLRPSQPMVTRYDHTATSTGLRAILLVGGFNQNGTATPVSEFVLFSSR